MLTPTHHATHRGESMRTSAAGAAAVIALALTSLTGCSATYTVDDCAAAITDSSTQTNRPKECKDVSDDDYTTLLMGHLLKKKGLDEVDKHPEDLLDYGEDGTVDRKQ